MPTVIGGTATSMHSPSRGLTHSIAPRKTRTFSTETVTCGTPSRNRPPASGTSAEERVIRSPDPACSTTGIGSLRLRSTNCSRMVAESRSPSRWDTKVPAQVKTTTATTAAAMPMASRSTPEALPPAARSSIISPSSIGATAAATAATRCRPIAKATRRFSDSSSTAKARRTSARSATGSWPVFAAGVLISVLIRPPW